MNWLIENWFLVVALVACASMAIWGTCRFAGLPTDKQKKKIKEWLVWACIEAERELQSGTGQLKLRKVYDAFCAVPAFSVAAKLISFETFSYWLKDALREAKEMLIKNINLAKYVYGDKADEEIEKLKRQLADTK